MPEISADYRTFTLRVKPGIYVADDAAFRGKKRELVAEDYVYSIKRLFDPALSSPSLGDIENDLAGSTALLKHVRAGNKMDYDALLEGLRTLDRYTIQIKLVEQNPQSMYNMANPVVVSAVAREVVVDHHSSDFGAHPVGTGAYKLAFLNRSSKMEFEYNPNFRESYFDGNPAADDPLGQAVLATMKGKRVPQLSRIAVTVNEEEQPRYLSFLNNELTFCFWYPALMQIWSCHRTCLRQISPSRAFNWDRIRAWKCVTYFST